MNIVEELVGVFKHHVNPKIGWLRSADARGADSAEVQRLSERLSASFEEAAREFLAKHPAATFGGLPDTGSTAEVRAWLLRLRDGGDATGKAMALKQSIRDLGQLYRLAVWAAWANGEDELALAEALESNRCALLDTALSAETRCDLDMLDVDDPGTDMPAWDPALDGSVDPASIQKREG